MFEPPPTAQVRNVNITGWLGYSPSRQPKFYLEFSAVENVIYYIQYRDDVTAAWKTAPTVVHGTGRTVTWLDEGPPNTETPPSEKRFYRVLSE